MKKSIMGLIVSIFAFATISLNAEIKLPLDFKIPDIELQSGIAFDFSVKQFALTGTATILKWNMINFNIGYLETMEHHKWLGGIGIKLKDLEDYGIVKFDFISSFLIASRIDIFVASDFLNPVSYGVMFTILSLKL